MYKLYLASIAFLLYCLGFGILWLHQIKLQFFALVISTLLAIVFLGIRKLWLQLRILLPFITMLFVIYSIFILLRISPAGTQPLAYWIVYGLPRLLLLLSSVLVFRLCFAFVCVDDLIRSDLGIHHKKYLILGKILYEAAFHSYRQIKIWQQLCPGMKDSPKSLKERFQRALAGTLGLILYTLAEARTKGERIDNLIQTCYKEKQ